MDEWDDPQTKALKAEVRQLKEFLHTADSRVEELVATNGKLEQALKQEKFLMQQVDEARQAEAKSCEELLERLVAMEDSQRDVRKKNTAKVNFLQAEIDRLNDELTKEKASRLQVMFSCSQKDSFVDKAQQEVEMMQRIIKACEAEGIAVGKEVQALKSALQASQRIVQQKERELGEADLDNHDHQTDSHFLRQRLVEAEAEASQWRRKFFAAHDNATQLQQAVDSRRPLPSKTRRRSGSGGGGRATSRLGLPSVAAGSSNGLSLQARLGPLSSGSAFGIGSSELGRAKPAPRTDCRSSTDLIRAHVRREAAPRSLTERPELWPPS